MGGEVDAALLGKFDRIREKVEQNLLDAQRVAAKYLGEFGRDLAVDRQ